LARRGGGGGYRGHEDDARGAPGPRGHDQFLRADPEGGRRRAESAHLSLDAPARRRPAPALEGHGRGLDRHPPAAPARRPMGRRGQALLTSSQARGFQVLKRSRRTFLSNLPTLVLGTASMKTTSSGSHHLATRGFRYS